MAEIVFVCCVEAGALEQMTIRMVASLRRFGGRFANAPLVAVTPRRGLPLSRNTRESFKTYNVVHLSFRAKERFSWNNFMNKPHALIAAVDQVPADIVCWLDSDVLIIGEPHELNLKQDVDFAAAAPDKNVGSTGPEDDNDAYWQALCTALDVSLEELPFIRTDVEQTDIRLYYNSGVFSFRPQTGLAEAFLQDCRTILDARVASRHAGIFFTDQVALGLTAHRLGLRQIQIPHRCNLAVGSRSDEPSPAQLEQATILHYHDAMWPHYWTSLLQMLESTRPDVHDFLSLMGPLGVQRNPAERLLLKLADKWRTRQRNKHLRTCVRY